LQAHTSFIGSEDFNGRLVTVVYYETRTFLMWRRYFIYAQIFWIGADVMGANISRAKIFHGRRYFMGANILMGANISWARIFHGCEYFMGANISWARIFHWREYFDVSKYFVCKLLSLGKRQYLMIFAVSSAQFYFCNEFFSNKFLL
jgi:hypothetical protein